MIRLILGLLLLTTTGCLAADSKRPPNILFVLADDLGWSDVGFHGGTIQTPHLDRLAAAGARLESFYVQPVCSPTRAALLTGRYPMRHGLQVGVVRPWAQYGLPLDERTLPQALQEAGYFTAMVGKWHLGHHQPEYLPTRRGFNHHYGHYNGALDYLDHTRDGGLDWHRNGTAVREAGYTTVLLGGEAVRLIDAQTNRRPFFLYVAFNAPHAPLQALPEHLTLYGHIADPKRRAYAAMVHTLDVQMGRIVAALDRNGLSRDTLIVFSSDNGGPTNQGATNGKLRARKGTLYEGGVRVPAFATWPGHIAPGTIIDQPLHMVDWYPTLLQLAGAPLKQALPLDGRDAWPTITRNAPSPHDEILLNTTPAGGALRAGPWKLVTNGGDTPDPDSPDAGAPTRNARTRIELFNLQNDPGEQTNLATQKPDLVRQMQSRLAHYAAQAIPPRVAPRPAGFTSPPVWGDSTSPTSVPRN